jgi:thioredoxin 1
MLRLRNYTWIFLLATGIFAVVFSNICCTGKASNNQVSANNVTPTKTASTDNSSSVIILTEKTFDEQIKKGVVLVDFWATWCRPCKMQGPIIEEVNTDITGKAVICKLDVDQNPAIANRFGVQSIPTMIIFKDGKVVNKFLGVTPKEDIINELNKFIN